MHRMAAPPPLASRPEIFEGKQCTFGCSIRLAVGGSCVTECWDGVGRVPSGITVGEGPYGIKGQDWPLEMGLPSGKCVDVHGGSPEQALSHYGAKAGSGH